MAGRRTKLRHSHQPSDFDSDAVNISDVPAPPPYRTNAELNFSVIRRHNPDVLSILSIAPFSVVYSFSPTTQQWEKRDVEGTLFVCHLSPSPNGADRYAVMVLNRRGLKNFTAELLNEGDVEITDQYVILQVANDNEVPQIIGLWIFEDTPTTRMLNAQIIQDCASQAESSRRAIQEQCQEQNKEGSGQFEEDEVDEGLDPPQSEAMGR